MFLIFFRERTELGLVRIPDPNSMFHVPKISEFAFRKEQERLFFSQYYTENTVIKAVFDALNRKPRKLSYNMTVDWFRYNRPSCYSDSEEWLYAIYDDDGFFTAQAICYMLYRLDILKLNWFYKEKHLERELFNSKAANDVVFVENVKIFSFLAVFFIIFVALMSLFISISKGTIVTFVAVLCVWYYAQTRERWIKST